MGRVSRFRLAYCYLAGSAGLAEAAEQHSAGTVQGQTCLLLFGRVLTEAAASDLSRDTRDAGIVIELVREYIEEMDT